jgi:hypothetical protein
MSLISGSEDAEKARQRVAWLAGDSHLIWSEILGTALDEDPCGRFSHVAERLIPDKLLRDRVLLAMREIRSRCLEREGRHSYCLARRDELPSDYLKRARSRLTGLDGEIDLASTAELVPRQSWMTDSQWGHAFYQYWVVMQGRQFPQIPYRSRATLFGGREYAFIEQFSIPARGVLTGHLVHGPMMGDLAEFLTIAGAAAACGDSDVALRAADYLLDAAKTPPLLVRQEDRTHLVLICND